MRASSWLLVAMLAACGDDDAAATPSFEPARIEGGGAANPGIDGALYVHVVDAATRLPIVGATVRVETSPRPTTGLTSLEGLFRLELGALRGPQTVTVVAPEHVTTTWVGVDAGNVTIPLDSLAPDTSLPTAQARGTIAGWDALAAPAEGHYLVAAVDFTRPKDLASAANLVQQAVRGTMTANVCLRESASPATCSWTLQSRVGRQLHFAFVLDGDRHDAANPMDDTFEVVALARGGEVELAAGQRLENQRLELTDRELLATLEVGLGTLPAGTTQVVGVPGVSTGDAGVMLLPTPVTPASPRVRVPRLEGDLADGNYWIIATATSAEPGVASSTIIRRSITSTASPVSLGDWLVPPAPASLSGRALAFTAVPGASTHSLDLRSAGGLVVWRLVVLDERTRIELPALDPDPLATAADSVVLTASEVTYDRRAFRLDELATEVTRSVTRSARLTR